MFINCRHCNALVATDPATDLPPERCPRCAGSLRRAEPAASPPTGTGTGTGTGHDAVASTVASAVAAVAAVSPPADPLPPAASARPAGTPDPVNDPPARGPMATGEADDAPGPAPSAARVPPAPVAPPPTAGAPETVSGADAEPIDPQAAAAPSPPGDTPPPSPRADEPVAPGDVPTAATTTGPGFLSATAPAATDSGRARRRWRMLAIVALALLLGLQVLLADRARLAADARWRPLVAATCGVFGCSLPPWREPAAFVLVAREVRPHPEVPGALRVRATFRNDARWPQAWPTLLLTLSDVEGRAVAARAFGADEYRGATTSAPIAPGQTADIALDIREPSVATVSFAFDFGH